MFDARESNWFLGFMISGDVGPLTFYTSQRSKHVIFDKKPPLNPPSQLQIRQRNIFRSIADAWRNLPPEAKARWEAASIKLGCRMNGYHVWVWWQTKRDLAGIRTIERKTGIPLVT